MHEKYITVVSQTFKRRIIKIKPLKRRKKLNFNYFNAIKWQNTLSTRLFYFKARNPRRIGILIVTVWVVSLGISLAPQLGWKDPDYLVRIAQGTCLVSQDTAYQVSAFGELRADPKYLINIHDWELLSYIRWNRESVNISRNITRNFKLLLVMSQTDFRLSEIVIEMSECLNGDKFSFSLFSRDEH